MRVVSVHEACVRDGAWWWHRTAEAVVRAWNPERGAAAPELRRGRARGRRLPCIDTGQVRLLARVSQPWPSATDEDRTNRDPRGDGLNKRANRLWRWLCTVWNPQSPFACSLSRRP
jgi:hypothetical protein